MSRHPTPIELHGLVGRTLDAGDDDHELLEHVSRCDECFEEYDRLWAEALADRPEIAEVLLDPAAGQRLESRLFRRIHLASLGTAGAWLVTRGFLCVLVGVLLPIVDPGHTPRSSVGGENP